MTTMTSWWESVTKGDIVWCWFPNYPGTEMPPKPRPAFVMRVYPPENDYSGNRIMVAYGTSKTTMRYQWDMIVSPYVWAGTGLATVTRFDFSQRMVMPFTHKWFNVPDWNARATTPILGRAPIEDVSFAAQLNKAVLAGNDKINEDRAKDEAKAVTKAASGAG
ncbi:MULTISPECIES: type II toxin-antitoxin system PemK/MazF family toxin [unclassified Burkholderia]|uniref:type II toxin-antitoxin system PemK/MazF family toxin n=1 Tax=unclassified Burkholderia TaxID=2613784 RepID=UPI0014207DD5|nr:MULTISPECIES: type II toxin-antitoxin system PemK/MazF family toxin [unclassified Burkholderia]NIE83764.1 type II toxin-antitoxin system PemK/MazF family toxin [Burkholderia sp. Tr-860]NIF62428.1 type II toxin-antitoxin system PemK/MazF family toxin [Burkholderia sp. Cy-647]NIF94326.1 type II toxin-antitoxin system PemK/MazF family toxin [Burkholderia sp. Ax-1720]